MDPKFELVYAASIDRPDAVECLLCHGADPNSTDDNGNTALHLTHSIKVAELLLKHDANINALNKKGSTPLYAAVKDLIFFMWLLTHGADPNAGKNPPLCQTVGYGLIDQTLMLLLHNADIHVVTKTKRTPLHFSALARVSSELITELLLERGSFIDATDSKGKSPLMLAVEAKKIRVVHYLLRHNANVNIHNHSGKTVLHKAANDDRIEIFKMLLEGGAHVDAVDKYGNTPMHYAVRNGCIECVKELVNHGAPLDITNWNGDTPLHYANKFRKHSIAYYLLTSGADNDIRNIKGQTPEKCFVEKSFKPIKY